jgi:UDP-N-acetylmuramoyl-L-alanyl-D-glutamate--2,6-diaminopimelate ligase
MLESAQLRAPDDPSGAFVVPAGGMSRLATESSVPIEGKPLAQLLDSIPEARVRGERSVPINDVTYRSMEVLPGALFFCVPGTRTDGHLFARQAVEAGAGAVVVERWLDVPVPQVLVPSVRRTMGPVAAAFFDQPSRALSMVGVTGTNGKTTTTFLLESIFRAAGRRPGIIGTTGVRIDGRHVPYARTTPEAPDLQRLLAAMRTDGVQACAMEVSSHGLHQFRVDGTRYTCSVFTNLSQDHLDYHGTLEEYFRAKARLFTAELSDRAAVNGDTPEGRILASRAEIPTTTFGLDEGVDVKASEVEVSSSGIAFVIDGLRVRSRLRGTFNVYNCLAAIAAAQEVGVNLDAIAEGIAGLAGVPGRLEAVEAGQRFPVLVDYAHTPDSLENVLRAARELGPGRLIVVFGCGGDRDRGKRPLMGEAATRLADLAIVTSDNPRSEDPLDIIAEIEPGARRGGGPYATEPDRRAAIAMALAEARPGDVVVIAGKGHETGQEFKDRTIPFDDRAVAAEELAALSRESRA